MRTTILIVLVLCASAAPASASIVSATTSNYYPDRGDPFPVLRVSVIAGAGEANAVVIDRAGAVATVRDAAGARPGAGCEAVTATEVRCSGAELETTTVELGDGDDRVVFLGPLSVGYGPELVADGGPGADRLVAGAGQAALSGGSGDDVLVGGATLDGGPGADELIGGPGFNAAVYATRSAPVHLDREGDADDGEAGEGDRIEANVEGLVGGSGDDELVGTGGDDRLDGGGGNDTLLALGGRDLLDGRGGSDRIDAGDGPDWVSGGPGADVLIAGAGDDKIYGDFDPDVERADAADVISGGPGADSLSGDGGLDAIDAGPGRDRVDGGADGADVRVRDGAADLVRCASPRAAGTASLDALDLARACATVDRVGVARPRLLQFGQGEYTLSDRIVLVSVGCSQDMPSACRGRLRLSRRGRTLAHMPVRVRRGTARVFKPRVPARLVSMPGERCKGHRIALSLRLRDAAGKPFTVRRRYVVASQALVCNAGSPTIEEIGPGWD